MSDETAEPSSQPDGEHESAKADIDTYATMRHSFENVFIAYEGEEPLAKDAGDTEFASIFKKDDEFKGEWVVAKSLEATFMFAGYPANTYPCRGERIGYLGFQTASTEITNVFGGASKVIIEVETGVERQDLQIVQWLYPYGEWSKIAEWKRFGPNGQQVVHLIEWLRHELEDEAFLKQYQALLAQSRSRAKLFWPNPPYYGPVKRPTPKATWQLWKRGHALANAWSEAVLAADGCGMWWPCRYLSPGGPWFVAVALRHVLSAEDFQELYAEFERLYPLSDLDRHASPGKYTIGKVKPKRSVGATPFALTGAACLAIGLFLGWIWNAHQTEVARHTIPSYYRDMGASVRDKANAILAHNADAQAIVSEYPGQKFLVAPDVIMNYGDQDWYCPDDATVFYFAGTDPSTDFEAHVNVRTRRVTTFQSLADETKALEAKVKAVTSEASPAEDQDERVDACVDGSVPLKYDTSRGDSDTSADDSP